MSNKTYYVYRGGGTKMRVAVVGLLFSPIGAVTLEWADLNCTFGSRQVLHGVSGAASSGRLLAIMGPSGSGKG